jgi:hypothetical protein
LTKRSLGGIEEGQRVVHPGHLAGQIAAGIGDRRHAVVGGVDLGLVEQEAAAGQHLIPGLEGDEGFADHRVTLLARRQQPRAALVQRPPQALRGVADGAEAQPVGDPAAAVADPAACGPSGVGHVARILPVEVVAAKVQQHLAFGAKGALEHLVESLGAQRRAGQQHGRRDHCRAAVSSK